MMNGGSYEENLDEYSDYDEDNDESRDYSRSISRSRGRKYRRHSKKATREEYSERGQNDIKNERGSRSRDRERKHHRHTKKRRRHRKRTHSRSGSHSRSRSCDKSSGRVHINPNFTNLGPTASSLLETNNALEAEVIRLRNELSCTGIRIRALENELSNGAVVRGTLEQELSVSRLNCQKLQQSSTKNLQIITSLRSDIANVRREKEEAQERFKQTELHLTANVEQVSFLTKRNEVLGKKCEQLVEKNRICREERDDAVKLAASLKKEVEGMQSTIDIRLAEYKRMEGELSLAKEKERLWKLERLEMERKLNTKDSLLSSERRRMEEIRKRDRAQLTELEKKLKCEQPGWESQLGVEAIFRAIETVKQEFVGQIQQLSDQVLPLKEKGYEMAAYHIASGRPPRILSAPPLSAVHIPIEISNSCPEMQRSSDIISTSSLKTDKVAEIDTTKNVLAVLAKIRANDAVDAINFTEQELIGGDDDTELAESCRDLIQIDAEALLNESVL